MKLRSRLVLSFLFVIAAAALTTFSFVRISTEKEFRSFVYSGDSEKAKVYALILSGYHAQYGSWDGVGDFIASISGGENKLLADRIAVVDLAGMVIADTSGKLLGTVHPERHLEHGIPVIANNRKEGTILVGSMVDSSLTGYSERFLKSIALSLLWATLFSAAVALGFSLILSSTIANPLASLNSAVKKVAAGDFPAGVLVHGRDEISELSHSFNAMTGELKRTEETKRQIIADSAHELRTPVTLIRGTIEAMIDGIYPMDVQTLRSVHEETVRLSRLIDMLRELESIESGTMDLETVDLAGIARNAVSSFASAAREKEIELGCFTPRDAPMEAMADSVRIGEIFYNLISNAIKYTPRGGKISVAVLPEPEAAAFVISVDDSGPGIPLAERERVFGRFYRLDKSRSRGEGGRGLGLAIVGEIVKAHGGSAAIADSKLGGARFTVFLPGRPWAVQPVP